MMHLLDARDESVERATTFLRTLAHAGRLRIVCALMERELNATELARRARLPAPALSQQAAILEGKGLIGRRREGRSVLYRLLGPETKAMADLLYRLFCKTRPSRAHRPKSKR